MEKENTSKGFEHEHGFERESGTESLIDLSAFFAISSAYFSAAFGQ